MLKKIQDRLSLGKNFVQKNTGHISLAVFIFGFFLDAFTLPSVTSSWAYFTGIIYASIVGTLLIMREYIKSDKISLNIFGKEESYYTNIFSIFISFFMGSLISFVFIYYLRGADILSGLPILIFILCIMIANEKVDSKNRLLFDIFVYSVSMTFLFIFMIPVLFKSMGNFVFFFSLVISCIFLYTFTRFIYRLDYDIDKELGVPNNISTITNDINSKLNSKLNLRLVSKVYNFLSKRYIRLSKKINFKIYEYILVIPAIILIMYFTNIIPAVPLTMRSSDIYGSIYANTQNSGIKNYTLLDKCAKNFNFFKSCSISYDNLKQDRIYFYNEIQAPTSLNAKVTHRWEYYNENNKKWQLVSNNSYNISGGRENGYRGYTNISNIKRGEYKVTVIIDDNRTLSSKRFEVR